MASITTDKNGNRRLQFKAPDGHRRTIRLGQVTKKTADQLRYHFEEIIAARTIGTPLSGSTAKWITDLSDAMRDRLAACGLVQRQERAELGPFMKRYINGRKSLKERTRKNLRRVAGLLTEYFGSDRQIHTITKGNADGWREFIPQYAGKLSN